MNDVESLGAITLAAVEVVNLVGTALNSADSLVDVIDLTCGALSTEVIDQEESRFADTSSGNPILVDVADR